MTASPGRRLCRTAIRPVRSARGPASTQPPPPLALNVLMCHATGVGDAATVGCSSAIMTLLHDEVVHAAEVADTAELNLLALGTCGQPSHAGSRGAPTSCRSEGRGLGRPPVAARRSRR